MKREKNTAAPAPAPTSAPAHEAAVARWHSAEAAHTDAVVRFNEVARAVSRMDAGRGSASNERLALLDAQIDMYEREDAAKVARIEASRALDAYELAEGLPDVVAFRPADVLAKLDENAREEARLMHELATVRAARPKIVDDARSACAAVAQRREAKGLPVPALHNSLAPSDTNEVKSRLERFGTDGHVPMKTNASKLVPLVDERRRLRITLETARREREAREAENERYRQALAEARKQDAARAERQREEIAAENAKILAQRDELEASFVKRQAAGQ